MHRDCTEPASVDVVYRRNLFGSAERTSVPAGLTVADTIARLPLPDRLRPFLCVAVGDRRIAPDRWHLVKPKPGTQVTALVVPQGGGQGGGNKALRTAALLAIMVAASAVASPVAAAAGGGFLGGLAGATASAAVGISGALVPFIHISRRPPA